MQSKQDHIQFNTKSGPVTVDIEALNKMKLALLSFLGGPGFPARFTEIRESMQAELKSSAPWVNRAEAGIGLWKLEDREGRLTLIHYPPPSNAPAYLYHATLENADAGWKIVSFEEEREFGPM